MFTDYKKTLGLVAAGAAAGAINGLFGAGGGMILVPLLTILTKIRDDEIFPTSVITIFPICIISLLFRLNSIDAAFITGFPYLIGSIAGGFLAARYGAKIPVAWLHRGLGILILWGGVRYLC